jgi:hypothetical protein
MMVQYATARRLRAVNDSYQQEAEVLLQLGIGRPTIARAMQVARRNGASIEQDLIASGSIDADSYYASLARGLRLPFLSAIDSSLVNDDKALDSQLLQARCVRLNCISEEKRSIGWRWIYVPLYWLMISVAAWRALLELPRKPFFWDKTPHVPVSTSEKLRRA